MPTEISHQATGVKYNWTFNQDVETGTFWDGSPYVIAKPGLKLLSCNMDTADGILEPNTIIPDLELGFMGKEGFKGELYINGLAKNPTPHTDINQFGNHRTNGNLHDSRSFGVFDKGWIEFKRVKDPNTGKYIQVPVPTNVQSSYSTFNLTKFMEMRAALHGDGVDLNVGDVLLLQYSNFDINCPYKWNISGAGGYPYQKIRNRSCSMSYGTVFVLDAHPSEVCFRPPVFWPEEDLKKRPLYAVSRLTSTLPMGDELVSDENDSNDYPPPTFANSPAMKTFAYGFALGNGINYAQCMPLLTAANSANITEANAVPAYGAYYQAPLLTRLSILYSKKVADDLRMNALKVIVQWGIDAFGSIKCYGATQSGAGQRPCAARPWSVLAGWFLQVPEMRMPETTMMQDTKRFDGFMKNDPNDDKVKKITKGVPAVVGRDITNNQWYDMIYGSRDTIEGKKRRLARRTSLEGVCYFKVVDDPNNVALHYDYLGSSHRRKFSGEGMVLTQTDSNEKVPLFKLPISTSSYYNVTGNFGKMQWMTDIPAELKGWPYTHDGKSTTMPMSYIRVTEGPGSGSTLYRILYAWGEIRGLEPSSHPTYFGYGFVLDKPWANGTPDQTSKFEMMTSVKENVGELLYVISPTESDPAMMDANLSPQTVYAPICEDLLVRIYGWMNYIKLKTGTNPDIDANSTFAHEYADKIVNKMPYNLCCYSTGYHANGCRPWEIAIMNMWYGKPLSNKKQEMAKTMDWSKAQNITSWCGVNTDGFGEIIPDFNNDGVVDGVDMGMLLSQWGTKNSDYDLNKDGVVDAADLTILQSSWGKKIRP